MLALPSTPANSPTGALAGNRLPEPICAPFRRWRVTLVFLVLAVCAAAVVANKYGQPLWPVEGSIVYTPLPLGDVSRADYVPCGPQTMISLVKSPQRLEAVIEELNLPITVRTLDRAIKVIQQPNVDAVRLTLEWPDPEVGRLIVDRVIANFVLDMAALRKLKIEESLQLLRQEQENHGRKLEAARADHAALTSGVSSYPVNELQQLNSSLNALLLDLNHHQDKLALVKREIEQWKVTVKSDKPRDDDTAYLQRKQMLLDSIRAQQERLDEVDSASVAKRKELDSQEKLMRTGATSQLEYSKVAGEMDLLNVRRRNTLAAIEAQQKELVELPRKHVRLVLAAKISEQEQVQQKLAALEREVAEKRRELSRVSTLLANEQEAAKRLEQSQTDYRVIAARILAIERLRTNTVTEFTAAHPAIVAAQPESSNRKSLAVLVLGGFMAIYFLGMIGFAWITQQRATRSPTYGLPVLAAASAHPNSEITASTLGLRRLALPVSNAIRASGGLVLFASHEAKINCEQYVMLVARYLAMLGESVLILDARIHQSTDTKSNGGVDNIEDFGVGSDKPDGENWDSTRTNCLSEYLRSQLEEPKRIRVSGANGVWFVPAGEPIPDADLLASDAMRRLLVRLSEQFDRVLVLCPPLDESLGVEYLAGYADGLVVLTEVGAGESAHCRHAVQSLQAAGLPWMGAVVLPPREEKPVPLETVSLTSATGDVEEEQMRAIEMQQLVAVEEHEVLEISAFNGQHSAMEVSDAVVIGKDASQAVVSLPPSGSHAVPGVLPPAGSASTKRKGRNRSSHKKPIPMVPSHEKPVSVDAGPITPQIQSSVFENAMPYVDELLPSAVMPESH